MVGAARVVSFTSHIDRLNGVNTIKYICADSMHSRYRWSLFRCMGLMMSDNWLCERSHTPRPMTLLFPTVRLFRCTPVQQDYLARNRGNFSRKMKQKSIIPALFIDARAERTRCRDTRQLIVQWRWCVADSDCQQAMNLNVFTVSAIEINLLKNN